MSAETYAYAGVGGARLRKDGAVGTLVVVHGAGHDHHSLLALAQAITAVDVVALDLPGRGRSPGTPAKSVREAADGVARVLDDPSLRGPVSFGGHSLGGAVAIELALSRALPGLVLLSTGARLRVLDHIIEDARAVTRGERTRTRDMGYGPGVDPAVRAPLELAFDAVPAETTLADWTMANGFDRLEAVSAVACPTLVVAGDADPFTPIKYAEHLARKIPSATLARIVGGSHMAIVEQTADVAAAIDAFLRA